MYVYMQVQCFLFCVVLLNASGDSGDFKWESDMTDVKLSLSAIDHATSHLDDSIPLSNEVCVCGSCM